MIRPVELLVTLFIYEIWSAQTQTMMGTSLAKLRFSGPIYWEFRNIKALHRGAFCQFSFRWIYYYGSNKSTGKETGKTHLYALFDDKAVKMELDAMVTQINDRYNLLSQNILFCLS